MDYRTTGSHSDSRSRAFFTSAQEPPPPRPRASKCTSVRIMYFGHPPNTGEPSCSGFGCDPGRDPCGNTNTSPAFPRTRAATRNFGAAPPPTAHVDPPTTALSPPTFVSDVVSFVVEGFRRGIRPPPPVRKRRGAALVIFSVEVHHGGVRAGRRRVLVRGGFIVVRHGDGSGKVAVARKPGESSNPGGGGQLASLSRRFSRSVRFEPDGVRADAVVFGEMRSKSRGERGHRRSRHLPPNGLDGRERRSVHAVRGGQPATRDPSSPLETSRPRRPSRRARDAALSRRGAGTSDERSDPRFEPTPRGCAASTTAASAAHARAPRTRRTTNAPARPEHPPASPPRHPPPPPPRRRETPPRTRRRR